MDVFAALLPAEHSSPELPILAELAELARSSAMPIHATKVYHVPRRWKSARF